jgi:serine phosphatase RsbU (regulator of sigma subunit)
MDAFERDARLQAALDRLTLLNEIATVLSSTLDAADGVRRVGRVLVPALGDWCAIDLLEDDGRLDRTCVNHRDGGLSVRGLTGPLPRPPAVPTGPLSRVLRGAGPLLLSAADVRPVDAARDPLEAADLEMYARLGGQTLFVAPLRARRRVVGALTVARAGGRAPFDEADQALVEDLTHRIALAVDNARLHAETQTIAERLQRSLLPDLPEIEGLDLAARYAPAGVTAEVGGDWYDSFPLPNGDTALIIGDVTGHDLHAAVTMSHVRNMLRGIACDRQEPPGKVMRRLDMAMDTLYAHQTATCVYGLLKGPVGGPYAFQWSSAGHPPPLLITGDGDTRFLDSGHGILLGALPRAERTEVSASLPAGGVLLLYTDGLIERPSENLDHSMTRLRRHAAALARGSLDALCDGLLEGLATNSHDDVALLAVRLPPARA